MSALQAQQTSVGLIHYSGLPLKKDTYHSEHFLLCLCDYAPTVLPVGTSSRTRATTRSPTTDEVPWTTPRLAKVDSGELPGVMNQCLVAHFLCFWPRENLGKKKSSPTAALPGSDTSRQALVLAGVGLALRLATAFPGHEQFHQLTPD